VGADGGLRRLGGRRHPGRGAGLSILHQGLRFRRRPIDCSFSSYQQCQASASGRDAYCAENPYFTAKAELQPDRSRQSRRRY
jgi:Protein of unknown function (DUF3551)